MKTIVTMKRDFYQTQVRQRNNDKFFCATDLLKYYNKSNGTNKVIAEFWSNKGTQEFMEALALDLNLNVGKTLYLKTDLVDTHKGKVNGGTWMHPYLFVKFAMWLSPTFEVQVIKWVYDNLIDFRNQAGDNYKEMCQAISEKYEEYYKSKPDPLVFKKEARFLNLLVFGDEKERTRNEATENQLKLMNQLQLANKRLIIQNISKEARFKKLREFRDLIL